LSKLYGRIRIRNEVCERERLVDMGKRRKKKEREREIDRQRERQIDRHRERQTDREKVEKAKMKMHLALILHCE